MKCIARLSHIAERVIQMGSVAGTKSNMFDVRDIRLMRLKNPRTGKFLHLSGEFPTDSEGEAWLGYQYQAEGMAAQYRAKGKRWPYRLVARVI